MMRSLFSGVAGLRTHQTRMDVIGNNIANVNTVGFKANNVTFQELIYQTTSNASGANNDTGRGGVNAKQIGLGVSTGAINTNITTPGSSQTTNNPFDLQISGDSFFIVSGGGENFFTRAGAFYVDGAGNLAMTSNGYNVMGWQADPETQEIRKDTVSPLRVMSPENSNADPEATKESYFKGIIDKNSTQLTDESGLVSSISFYDEKGFGYVAKFSVKNFNGTGDDKTDLPEGVFKLDIADIIDSSTNESLVLGENGKPNSAAIEKYFKFAAGDTPGTGQGTGTSIYLYYDTVDGSFLGWTPSTSTPVSLKKGPDGEVANKPAGFSADKFQLNKQTGDPAIKVYDKDGNEKATGISTDGFVNINVAADTTTMWDNNQTSTLAGKPGDYDGNYMGRKVGKMSGLTVDQSGKIFASYDNGTQRVLGQIAVAQFENPSGLEKIGENLYATTQNSGDFDGIGMDVTSDGVGKLTAGVLEMSNVDLSAEFTDMITTQRGFQANSRIITVSDSMLEELTNLKR
ncbi:MAG TPA: flagellar hook protein [Lachnospiraceae bacterium]|nr:flagellar hook protein [Lachnospiraceae bacterium]